MSDFNWLENSQTVFEEGLKAAPAPFRNATRKGLLKGLAKVVGEGGDVREADLVKAMKDSTPAPFKAQGMKAIEPFLTDPSILND
jgi:hypothetical protein